MTVSGSFTNPSLAPALTLPGVSSAASLAADNRWTSSGKMAFVLALSMFLSAIPGLRPQLLGLSIHPYLLLLAACLPFAVSARSQGRATDLTRTSVLLGIGLLLSTAAGSGLTDTSLKTLIKWGTLAATFFVVERLILTIADQKYIFGAISQRHNTHTVNAHFVRQHGTRYQGQ